MSELMERAPDASTRLVRLASVPLAVAYLAIPLGMGVLGFLDVSTQASPWLPWLVLAGFGCVIAMLFRRSGVPVKKRFLFETFMFLILCAILVLHGQDIVWQIEPALPYVHEAVPLVMLLFCFLWTRTFGLSDRAAFQRYGAALGLLCVVDLAVEGAMFQAVPTVRWIGNADVLAGLLLVSLCASLRPGTNDGGEFEPDQGHRVWRALTMLGLLACLSRTGLFGAAWVFLCFGRGGKGVRIAYCLLCMGLIVGTFFLPVTASSSVRYIDYWLWVEGVRIFAENPALLLTGFPVSLSLPVEIPVGMSSIWEAATGLPSLLGVYLSQVPSFWLRLVMGWGLGMPLLLLVALFFMLFRRLTRMGAGLTAALFAQGMTTPLLFEPSLAVAIGLGFFVALSRPGHRPNVRSRKVETPETKPETPIKNGSPEEWDMSPL